MAVFTSVSKDQASAWFANFDLGVVQDLQGISSGIENSNFFVTLGGKRYVLTLFERLQANQLPFYLGLMKHLASHGVNCPDPLPDRHGKLLGTLNGKPAAVVSCLPGKANMLPAAAHCSSVGALLANMHLAARDYPDRLENLRGLAWWQATAPKVAPFLTPDQASLLRDEIEQQTRFAATELYRSLPTSAVHADLFRDNVLFDEKPGAAPVSGAIDFYFAGVDTWLFDLAVTCNDWCIEDATGHWQDGLLKAFLDGYRSNRVPTSEEQQAWPMLLRAAALRFWISRLFDFHLPRPAQMVTPKDPAHCERVLRARRDASQPGL